MELYIGGYAQGKLDYVKLQNPKALVFDENNFEELFVEKPVCFSDGIEVTVLNNFHLCVRKLLEEGQSPESIAEKWLPLWNWEKLIIISDEIGNGIVPLEKADRIYRECTGRLLCEIAKQAVKVVRIVCGIPQQIK